MRYFNSANRLWIIFLFLSVAFVRLSFAGYRQYRKRREPEAELHYGRFSTRLRELHPPLRDVELRV